MVSPVHDLTTLEPDSVRRASSGASPPSSDSVTNQVYVLGALPCDSNTLCALFSDGMYDLGVEIGKV